MPDTQSAEKQSALRGMGAELRTVPAVPYKNPDNYVHQARRLAEAMAANTPGGVFYANQWDNLANRNGHTVSTEPAIWAQTGGKVDGRSEEHTSELQSLMRLSYAGFCLQKKKNHQYKLVLLRGFNICKIAEYFFIAR